MQACHGTGHQSTQAGGHPFHSSKACSCCAAHVVPLQCSYSSDLARLSNTPLELSRSVKCTCFLLFCHTCSPDLACLKHHSSLASLAIEAPNTGWQLSSLQLGYLVHIDTLKQLSLAGRCWGPGHDHAGQQHSGPNHLVAGGSPGVASRSPGALRSGMSVTTQPSSSRQE